MDGDSRGLIMLPGRHGTARVLHTICHGYFLVHTSVNIYQFRTSYEKLSRLKSDWSIRNLIDQSDFWVTDQVSEWPIIFFCDESTACMQCQRATQTTNQQQQQQCHVALVASSIDNNGASCRSMTATTPKVPQVASPGFRLLLTRPASSKRSNNINRLKTY